MPKKLFEWRHLDQYSLDDDWQEVWELDAWLAAKAGAGEWDSEDCYMARSNETRTFEVRDEDGKVTRWSVWGEVRPYYYASPLPEQATTEQS